MWNKDEVKGKAKKIKGDLKEKTGRAVGNPDLEEEGQAEQVEGNVQDNVGRARRKVGDAVKKAGKAISGK